MGGRGALDNRSKPSLSLGRRVFYGSVILAAVPVIYLFVGRGMRFFRVPSNSMEPAIHVSDYIMTLRQEGYRRGDIVVLEDPTAGGEYIVKRIIAVGGDRISIRGGAVFINGGYASEPYRLEPIDYSMEEYLVDEGDVFLLGDNGNWSVDSHDWAAGIEDSDTVQPGGVPGDLIVGRVRYIYLPLDRMQKLRSYPLRFLGGAA